MYTVASYLLHPYVLLLLLLVFALLHLWRKRAVQPLRLRWLALSLAILIVLSTPALGHFLVGSLEWQYPPLDERPADMQAIVVLGAGVLPPDQGRTQAELDPSSLYRSLAAAQLYRQWGPQLILVSGGKPDPSVTGPAAGDLMARLLIDLGVRPEDVIVENLSRTTYENATESLKLLEQRQITRIVLVTDAVHLPRAVLSFRKQGLDVVPCGCHHLKTEFKASFFDFLPCVSGLSDIESASHEWLGLAWYRLRGRI